MWVNLEANSSCKRRNCSQHWSLFDGLKEYCTFKNYYNHNQNFRRASTPFGGDHFNGQHSNFEGRRDHQNNNYSNGRGYRKRRGWNSQFRQRQQEFHDHRNQGYGRQRNYADSNPNSPPYPIFRPGYEEFLNYSRGPRSSLDYYPPLKNEDFALDNERKRSLLDFERNNFRGQSVGRDTFESEIRNNSGPGRLKRSHSVADLSSRVAANNRKSCEREIKKSPFKSKSPGSKADKVKNRPTESSTCENIALFRTIQNDNSKGDLSKIQKITFSSDSEQDEENLQKNTPKRTKISLKDDEKVSTENKKKKKLPDTFSWGNSDEEDYKNWSDGKNDDGEKYLFDANNLPKYDGETPFGKEGGVVLQVYACIFCAVVYKTKAQLQQHFLMRSHYNKYKNILNDAEVMQMFKKC